MKFRNASLWFRVTLEDLSILFIYVEIYRISAFSGMADGQDLDLADLRERVADKLHEILTSETARVWGLSVTRVKLEEELGLEKDFLLKQGNQMFMLELQKRVEELKADGAKKPSKPPKPAVKKRKVSVKEPDSSFEGSSSESTISSSSSESERPRRKRGRTSVKNAQRKSMTKAKFLAGAEHYDCSVGTLEFKVAPKQFRTGSCGWSYNNKVDLQVNGKVVKAQLGLNVTVIGSQAWKDGKESKVASSEED